MPAYSPQALHSLFQPLTTARAESAFPIHLRGTGHLAVTVDTLLAGVHFPVDTEAADIGYKSLAVNLSDLAAMGALPLGFTLQLLLPEWDEDWLRAFAGGLQALRAEHALDLYQVAAQPGPLAIIVHAYGQLPDAAAMRRDGARPGDILYVSGTLGDAAYALQAWPAIAREEHAHARYLVQRLARPTPRIALGQAVRARVHAAIDISDGLLADLGHILEASGVGARLELERLPASPALAAAVPDLRERQRWQCGGDDYELCISVAASDCEAVERQAATAGVALSRIGEITAGPGLHLTLQGEEYTLPLRGYDHFAEGDGA